MRNTPCYKLLSFSALVVPLLLIAGCSGSDGTDGATGPAGSAGSDGAGSSIPDQDIIVQVDTTGDGTADTIAVLDPVAFGVKRFAAVDIGSDSSLNNSHKSYFHTGQEWVGGGGDLWAFDKSTLALSARVDNPSFQMNREGLVGAGQVNTKSAATTANLSKEMRSFLGRTLLTPEEAARVDMCELQALAGAGSSATKAPADTIVHNLGYSPVGLELTPDGTMGVVGVRQGDHLLFMDTDASSATFGTPLRFIDQRRGDIKDKTNAVVATFTALYDIGSGGAPGNLHTTRAPGTGSETDGETYVEPCDTNIIANSDDEVWFWSVDVDGDTYTLARVDTITSATPTVIQIPVPVVDDTATAGGASGLQYVGPWMGSLVNRAIDNGIMIGTSENEGENSESLWDLSDTANPVEVGRYVDDLATIKGGGTCTGGAAGGPTLTGPFVDGNTFAVNIDFTSTGGACTAVNYTYNSVPSSGDDLSGSAGSGYVTTAFLTKVTASDPGPSFILNGLAGRAGTSEGNVSVITGSGATTKVFSDEIWLTTFRQGTLCSALATSDCDIFQVIDLSTDAPWLISEAVRISSAFAGKFGIDNRFYQVVGGSLQVIDTNSSQRTLNTITLDPTTGAPWSIKSVNLRLP